MAGHLVRRAGHKRPDPVAFLRGCVKRDHCISAIEVIESRPCNRIRRAGIGQSLNRDGRRASRDDAITQAGIAHAQARSPGWQCGHGCAVCVVQRDLIRRAGRVAVHHERTGIVASHLNDHTRKRRHPGEAAFDDVSIRPAVDDGKGSRRLDADDHARRPSGRERAGTGRDSDGVAAEDVAGGRRLGVDGVGCCQLEACGAGRGCAHFVRRVPPLCGALARQRLAGLVNRIFRVAAEGNQRSIADQDAACRDFEFALADAQQHFHPLIARGREEAMRRQQVIGVHTPLACNLSNWVVDSDLVALGRGLVERIAAPHSAAAFRLRLGHQRDDEHRGRHCDGRIDEHRGRADRLFRLRRDIYHIVRRDDEAIPLPGRHQGAIHLEADRVNVALAV